MRKIIISALCLSNSLTGFAQAPTTKEIMKNKITRMIVYSESNMFDNSKPDTAISTFDKNGNVIFEDKGILGVFETRYTYNKEGLAVQCIRFNGNKYKMDSSDYVYKTDGSYIKYSYSSNQSMGLAGGRVNQKFYDSKGLLIREINPVPPLNDKSDTIFRSWRYDSRGNNISLTTSFSMPNSTPDETNYKIKYNAAGRMTERTWPSKYSTTILDKETFKYNKLGLISEYYKIQHGKKRDLTYKDTYEYQ